VNLPTAKKFAGMTIRRAAGLGVKYPSASVGDPLAEVFEKK